MVFLCIPRGQWEWEGREEGAVGMMGRQDVSEVIGGEYALQVCNRYVCAMHVNRYVNMCGSYKVIPGSGPWIAGWGQESRAGAKQCRLVNE